MFSLSFVLTLLLACHCVRAVGRWCRLTTDLEAAVSRQDPLGPAHRCIIVPDDALDAAGVPVNARCVCVLAGETRILPGNVFRQRGVVEPISHFSPLRSFQSGPPFTPVLLTLSSHRQFRAAARALVRAGEATLGRSGRHRMAAPQRAQIPR